MSNRWYHLKFVKLIRGLHYFLYECTHSHTYRHTCIIVLFLPCLIFHLGVLVHPSNLWTTIKVWFSAYIALVSALHFLRFSLSHHKSLTTISLLTNEENELEESEITFMVTGLRSEGWQWDYRARTIKHQTLQILKLLECATPMFII